MTLAAAERLDDAALLETADPCRILRQVASSAAQVREALRRRKPASAGWSRGAARARSWCPAWADPVAGDVLAAVAATAARSR